MKYLDEIFSHAEEVYPEECCGVLTDKDIYIPITNIADNPLEEFEFNKKEYIEAYMQNTIKAIVHSHPDSDATPSPHDTKVCNFLKIPYLIVGFPSKDMKYIEPNA